MNGLIERYIDVKRHEITPLIYSFVYFFCLLCAYYIIRPLRDEMGILGGIENLPWVFSGTFIIILLMAPVFGWLCSRFQRSRLLPIVYLFFISNLLIFYVLFLFDISSSIVARSFFIWVSVFNLFVVSVFWSFMDDIYDKDQAKRLFGSIAAGGTTGAIVGPFITSWLVQPLGTENLLLISITFISLCLLCINKLSQWFDIQPQAQIDKSYQQPVSGHWFSGFTLIIKSKYLLGICLLILLYTTLSTFLYFQQASIIKLSFENSEQRTAVFAMIDLAVNVLTLTIQFFFTSRIVKHLGLSWTLSMIPILLCVGFIALSLSPVLVVLIFVQVFRRAGNYAIMRPAREMLYVVLGREEKYKAKNFIDTAVYRGGDAMSAWVYDGMKLLGLSISQIALVAAPLAAIWALIAFQLGRQRELIAKQTGDDNE